MQWVAELWDGVGVCQQQGRGFTACMGDWEVLILRITVDKPARVRMAPGWGNKMPD